MERVNYDCRPGDVIDLCTGPGVRIRGRVLETYPTGVRIQADDGSTAFYYYKELRERDAFYVAKCEPVNRPESFRP